MKKFIITTILSLFLLSNIQQASAMGLFYTNAEYPVTATGVKITNLHNLKRGESSAINILWAVEIGDAGVYKAAKDGNIKQISFIDVREKTVFFFFRRIKTIVYGE